jgi:hypothetical protein
VKQFKTALGEEILGLLLLETGSSTSASLQRSSHFMIYFVTEIIS